MRITFGKLVHHYTSAFWLPALGLALAASVAAGCGGDSTGSPGSGGSGGSSAGSAGNSGGGNSGGGTTGSGGSAGSAGTAGSSGGNVGSGGNSTAGAGGGTGGGTGGNVGSGGNSTAGAGGSAGSTSGAGGSAGNGGGGTTGGAQAGRGGASAGNSGTGGLAGATAGAGGRGGSSGGSTGSGGTGTLACPANATFCSGFDATSTDPPTGAVYMANAGPGSWTRDFVIDTSVKNSGAGSLRVKSASGDTGTSGSAYKMLAVPGTSGAFWVRFLMRSDAAIGMAEHNVFAGASTGNSPNDGVIEFAEDVGVAFNTSDDVRWPTGYGRLSGGGTMPYSLPANMWHCIEISFDGTGRVQQLFVGGAQLINATSYPASARAITWFKFGFNQLHGPARSLWYDDVAVAPTRVGGCN